MRVGLTWRRLRVGLRVFRPIAVNVGLRYARSRRSFVSFVSVLALVGLALSVAVLVFVQAVAEGFDRELETRILRLTPHVTAMARDPRQDMASALASVRAVQGVQGAAAVASGVALAAAGERVAGVLLTGVEPDEYLAVSQVFEHVEGDAGLAAGSFHVVLGGLLAERLGVGPGDAVSLAVPQGSLSPLGAFPRQKRFVVTGLAHTASQLDASLAVAHRADVAALFRVNAAGTSLEISLERPLVVHDVLGDIARALHVGPFSLRVWTQSFGPLHRAIATTKQMLFLLLSLLVAVAAFNLVSSLVMVVNERRGDVAVLRTVGGRTGQVVTAFLVLGGLVALVGITLGVAGGVGLGYGAEAGFPLLEAVLDTRLMAEYLVTELPVAFVASDILRVVVTSFGLCLLACVYPAWRAARLNPADVLQHE